MSVNIYTDQMQHAQLFGKPVLTTNWLVPRETVPDGWHCYDMVGTDADPGDHSKLVDYASYLHSGTVLSPAPLKRGGTAERRIGKKDYFLHGEEMDLETFCEEYGLVCPENPIKFELRPASPDEDEAGIFYALTPEEDDIGGPGETQRSGFAGERKKERNKAEFSPSGGNGAGGVSSDEGRWCRGHGGEISGSSEQNYGYVVETERYRYCLRCNPVRGDYQAYLTCFDKQAQQMGLARQGRQAQEAQAQDMTMGGLNL